jgi:hypothetical protein
LGNRQRGHKSYAAPVCSRTAPRFVIRVALMKRTTTTHGRAVAGHITFADSAV